MSSPDATVTTHLDIVLLKSNPLTSLPDNLFTTGSFHCESENLRSVPNGLCAGKSVFLRRCTQLANAATVLFAGENLTVFACDQLKWIAGYAVVAGQIDVRHCASLEKISNTLKIQKPMGERIISSSVFMSSCVNAEHLANRLLFHADGTSYEVRESYNPKLRRLAWSVLTQNSEVTFKECNDAQVIATEISSDQNIVVRDSPKLTHIAKTIHSGAGLDVQNCQHLEIVAKRLTTKGDAEFGDLQDLQQMTASSSKIDGNLQFFHCPQLHTFAKTVSVKGALILNDCARIETLSFSERFDVRGGMSIASCDAMTEIKGVNTIGGGLLLEACDKLSKLPSRLHVAGSVSFWRLPRLEIPPATWTVSRDMTFEECDALISLPTFAAIAGNLTIRDCNRLIDLPAIRAPQMRSYASAELEDVVAKAMPNYPGLYVSGTEVKIEHCKNLRNLTGSIVLPEAEKIQKWERIRVERKVESEWFDSRADEWVDARFEDDWRYELRTFESRYKRHLSLQGCPNILKMPRRLLVSGRLEVFPRGDDTSWATRQARDSEGRVIEERSTS